MHLYPCTGPAAWPVDSAPGQSGTTRPGARCRAVGLERGNTQRRGHPERAAGRNFVPQMLNYESVGGVNFKRLPLPLARKWWRAASSGPAQTPHLPGAQPQRTGRGAEIFTAEDAEQTRGPGGAKRPRTRWRLGCPGVPAKPTPAAPTCAQGPAPGAPAPPYALLTDV